MGGLRVLVLFGGRSGEHEVSVQSAHLVARSLLELGHTVVGAGITLDGRFVRCDPLAVSGRIPSDAPPYRFPLDPGEPRDVDVAFPVLHGPFGEDGSLQGACEIAKLPYVGAGIEGSAIGLNKVVQKRLFVEAGLPVVDFVAFERAGWETDAQDVRARCAKLGFPCFAKPARLGSSVGISKISDEDMLSPAIERALRHDDLVIVESFGARRELEVGVLDEPREVSKVGEVVPEGDFYDYRAKYAGEWTELIVPADVPSSVAGSVADLALRAFAASRCEGLARVDFFFDPGTERLIVNELNSMPGLTPASMFPRVWEASGLSFPAVVERLIAHALARHERRTRLDRARAAAHDEEVAT